MPVERYKNAQPTYFAKKMLTYYQANRQQRHVHDLGIANFRVLTVTTTSERVERMLSALNGITEGRGSNMFLFTDVAKLAASNPIDLEWVSGTTEAGSGAFDRLIASFDVGLDDGRVNGRNCLASGCVKRRGRAVVGYSSC